LITMANSMDNYINTMKIKFLEEELQELKEENKKLKLLIVDMIREKMK